MATVLVAVAASPVHSATTASTHFATAAESAPSSLFLPAPQGGLEWAWFLPGNRILAAPEEGAAVLARLPALAYLPILASEGRWAKVSYQARRGWADTRWQPPHDRGSAHRGILRERADPVRGNDPWRLRAAQEILGVRSTEVKVGRYRLYTDVQDEDLLAFLDSAAVAAEEGYFARYGRLPSGDPVRSAVLFATEEGYRRFAETQSTPNPGTNLGHAGSGVLAFYAEGRSRRDLATTLVHEIAHLLNDRALARRLPPWLEEGIATDLGSVWIEPFPTPDVFAASRGEILSVAIQGFEGSLSGLEAMDRTGRLPHLDHLLGLDREDFYRPETLFPSYAQSAVLIRYLLDGKDGRLADGFRAFLARVAVGTPARLFELIERDVDELDRGFRQWLATEFGAVWWRLAVAYPGMVSVELGPDGRIALRGPLAAGRPGRRTARSGADSGAGPGRRAGAPPRPSTPRPGTPTRASVPGRTAAERTEPELVISFRLVAQASPESVVVEPIRIDPEPRSYIDAVAGVSEPAIVRLQATVDESGAVLDARVEPAFDPALDALLVEDVTGWRFTPGTVDGQPAEFSLNVYIVIEGPAASTATW